MTYYTGFLLSSERVECKHLRLHFRASADNKLVYCNEREALCKCLRLPRNHPVLYEVVFTYPTNAFRPLHYFCYHNGMQYVIRLQKKEITYTLRQNRHVRRMRITIHHDSRIIVTVPHRVSQRVAEQFITSKSLWICNKLAYTQSLNISAPKKISKQDYLRYKSAAKALAHDRLAYFNTIYTFPYRRIAIRNQKTRWGSCSKMGNLNFNYRIALLPPHLSDYIIVHELCHVAELNHSRTFWDLVAKTIPRHAELRKELRKNGLIHNIS